MFEKSQSETRFFPKHLTQLQLADYAKSAFRPKNLFCGDINLLRFLLSSVTFSSQYAGYGPCMLLLTLADFFINSCINIDSRTVVLTKDAESEENAHDLLGQM